MMQFRSLTDMTEMVRARAHSLPDDIELVVGIPRSGMMPASMIALLRDWPLLDLESFLRGDGTATGVTRPIPTLSDLNNLRKVLIVEDSISSGRSIAAAKKRIIDAYPKLDCTYLAVFAAPQTKQLVDHHFDIVKLPRIFEWNLMNSWVCGEAAFDLDGVLCRDPTEAENDDGPNYLKFIETAEVLRKPGQQLHRITTSRLDTYREETESWLAKAGIAYGTLDMMSGVTARERREGALHAPFKARHYVADKNAALFIESNSGQAQKIAHLSGKPVLDIENMQIVDPKKASLQYVSRTAENLSKSMRTHSGNILKRLSLGLTRNK